MFHAPHPANFPSVERGILGTTSFEVKRKDARITSRRTGFEHVGGKIERHRSASDGRWL